MDKQFDMSLDLSPKSMVLALQHLIAMFGATVLVPILTGFDTSVALFTAGLGTLIFHLCTKGKVPVFVGSSFAFIPVILQVSGIYQNLAYAQGGMVVAGFLYVLFSLAVKRIGMKRINKYLPPQVIGPMIIVIGLGLIPTAYDMAKGNLTIALITLTTAILVSKFATGFFKQLSLVAGVLVGYLISVALNLVDTSAVASASLISVPNFTLPKFDIGAIAIIAPVVIATLMEHIGDIKTNGAVVGKDFVADPGLNRTLLGDGFATMAAACLGGPANTTYGENTAVLALTKNYNPAIIRLAAIFAMCLAFLSKVGASITTIPTFVQGGISLLLFSMIALVGAKTIYYARVEPNWKNLLIMGSIIVLGFFGKYIEAYFEIRLGIPVTKDIYISGLSFAAIVGIILNIILNKKPVRKKSV